MGRPTRNLRTDQRFHLINRAVHSQDLFSIEDDWVLFESLIGRVCDDSALKINAYALMSNHFHFLADLSGCDERSRVSAGIGELQSTYAKYFNGRTRRRGPLFEPRFLSFGADGDTKIHRIVRYIHRNPIDICGPRALGAYRWSSLPVYLGRRTPPPWLDCDLFAPSDPIAHLADLSACHVDDLRPLDGLPPQRRTSLDAVVRAVRSVPSSIADAQMHRSIIALLALDLRAADVMDIAIKLDRSPCRTRELAARARTMRADDPTFDMLVAKIENDLAHGRHNTQ